LAAPAFAAPAYNADPLTVSGRFAAPKAPDGPLKANVRVDAAAVAEPDAAMLGGKADRVQPAVKAALEASLRNFGYLAPPGGTAAVALSVTLDPLEVTTDDKGVAVVARLRVEPVGAEAACIPRLAEARYKALAPMKAVGEQRVAAWVAVVGLAAVGVNASQLAVGQLQTAQASDQSVNALRERTESESVSPDGSAKGLARHAAVNATQLAAADLIRQLGKGTCPAQQPQSPAA
jgi:hypothetical protein